MSDRRLTVSVKFPNNGKGWCFLLADIVNDIRHLASDNKKVREKALWDLFELCWHQGTLYWQAAFVAPFLIERLPHESEPELLEIILWIFAPLACREALLVIRLRNSIGPVPLMGKFTEKSMFTSICWNIPRPKLELQQYTCLHSVSEMLR